MKLEGDIGEIHLVEHLVELGRQNFTGAIRFENDGIIKILYFKGGDILSASTNDRTDSVDEILMRANKVSRDHVKQALAKRKESETLGDALLNLGFITKKELLWARRVQVIGVIRSITNWTAGSFTMVADYLPKREEGTHFPLQQIIVELIVTEPDRGKVERQVDGGDAVFAKSPEFDSSFKRLGLNEDADAIAAQINGTRSASDIASLAAKDPFNTYKLLHALAMLGLLDRATAAGVKPVPGFEDDFASAGMADAADMFESQPVPELELAPVPEFSTPPESEYTPPAPLFVPPPEPPLIEPPPRLERAAPIPQPVVAPPRRNQFDLDDEGGIPAAPLPATVVVPPRRPERTQTAAKSTRGPEKASGGRFTALIVVIVLAIAGFAAYAGWMWWQGREAAPIAVQQPPKATPPVSATSSPPSQTAPTTTIASQTPLVISATSPATDTSDPPLAPNIVPAKPKPSPPPASVATATTRPAAPATAPTRPATVDAQRSRYDAMARQFAATVRGNFTIQVALVCQTSSIANALDVGGDSVWFTPTTYRGQSCYRLFWNRYETREAAQRGLQEVPDALSTGANPVVIGVPRG